ncbi:MAG TPA: hypothetical protein VJ741_15050 [Solirubrobacteraceae bacterium]|nr:hypothetical protein [Solirubrobacteraceae bacterium]
MSNPFNRRLAVVIAAIACLASAPAAAASTGTTLTLDQSAGNAAGSSADLGLDLKFTNSGTDSPRDLTIILPPGLLANASIDGGACLRSRNVTGTACKVGSGTVTATPDLVGILNVPLPVSVPVSFYLVPPPAPGDLAGLAVMGLGEQLGATGAINVRPSGDPAGVGVTISLVLPNQLPLSLPGLPPVNLTQISLDEINSTFKALRYPATCPRPTANLTVDVDSYADSAARSVAAPLTVTRCGALPYAPAFQATAARDAGDRQVKLDTTVTQTASQAPSRSIVLTFPPATLAPNLGSIQALCLDPSSGTCQSVGAVTAKSPLYPRPLSGDVYLTGSSSGLSLTLAFPSPFPLTLTGAVNLLTNSATFTGLPDIPLTNLSVSLAGGPQGLFLTTCKTPGGTATATLTDQNGDRTLTVPSAFTVSGCPSTGAGSGPGGTAGHGGAAGGVFAAGTALGHAGASLKKTHHKPSRSHKHKPKRRRHPHRHRH